MSEPTPPPPSPTAAALRRRGRWIRSLDDPAFGGFGDGRHVDDDALLRALEAMPPEGGTLVLPAGRTWLFDSVDLGRVGRRDWTLLATGAVVRKAPRTAYHLFRDEAGTSDGLAVVGGRFELAADAFRPGDTVSAFFLVRADAVTFAGCTVVDGVEEGLKLYKPVGARIARCRFERLRNNGVQLHAPAADGFRGDPATRPDRDTRDVRVTDCRFVDVDDGLDGMEGQGVSVSGTSATVTARDVRVSRCTFEGCVRGAWAEFNQAGNPGVDVHFLDNRVRRCELHGLGLVGVRDGSVRDNRLVDVGTLVPDPLRTAGSEVAGIVVSGSERVPGEGCSVVGNAVLETRPPADARMQFGVLVRRQRRLTLEGNRVRGATVADVRVEA